ncbi:MAG: NlpC/P60 family protein [Gemmatimonadota bacterium]
MSFAIVRVSWTPLRREPGHASEMVSQVLLGEVVEILESARSGDSSPDWAAARAPDGYEGFVTRGSLRECDAAAAREWSGQADLTSLGTGLSPLKGGVATPRYAPWGARLVSGEAGVIELPDGTRADPSDATRLVADAERPDRYPYDPAALVRTAAMWLGTPYVWGGRTEHGVDCSGYVQAVFGLHGHALARDSRDQCAAGPRVVSAAGETESPAGDLWFFGWDGGPVSHVGICLGGRRMIHASETRGCVAIDELGEGDFGRRLADGFVGAVRPPG